MATSTVIKCPKCPRVVSEQPKAVVYYYDPKYKCKCGYKGVVRWFKETKKKKKKRPNVHNSA